MPVLPDHLRATHYLSATLCRRKHVYAGTPLALRRRSNRYCAECHRLYGHKPRTPRDPPRAEPETGAASAHARARQAAGGENQDTAPETGADVVQAARGLALGGHTTHVTAPAHDECLPGYMRDTVTLSATLCHHQHHRYRSSGKTLRFVADQTCVMCNAEERTTSLQSQGGAHV